MPLQIDNSLLPGHRFKFAEPIIPELIHDPDVIHDSPLISDMFFNCKDNMINIPPHGSAFIFMGGGHEIMRITKGGRFIVDGNIVTDDATEVYEYFIKFLELNVGPIPGISS